MKPSASTRALLGCALGVALAGCASPPRDTSLPEPRPLGADHAAIPPHEVDAACTEPAANEPSGTLTLEEARRQALQRNPGLAAYSHHVQAASALRRQAALFPNPELELELEEYDRGGAGWDSSESTVALAQEFLLGGKRRWRTEAARAQGELAGWDYEARRLDVFADTTRRFVEVLAAQEGLDLARSMVDLAEATHRAVVERVTAGKEPKLQASKAEAELAMARIGVTDAGNRLEVARRRLAAAWGGETAAFDHAEGDLDGVLETVPPKSRLEPLLARNPDLARWEAELRLREAGLEAAKAERIPNVTAAVGYHQYREDETDALSFGVGLPLPLFDRNQGNVAAAEHRLAQARAQRRAVEAALAADLAAARTGLVSAHRRVTALRDQVLPTTEEAFGAASEGYRQGKFGFLDMLDAQRGLFEARGALLKAQQDYRSALVEVQRITGTGIEALNAREEEVHP